MDQPELAALGRHLLEAWALAAAIMLLGWIVQVVRRDATLVDVLWAANLGLVALLFAFTADGLSARRVLVAAVALAWALRLGGYLLLSRAIGKPEDARYRALRAKWGASANRKFFLFFQAQALLDAILAIPFVLAASNRADEIVALEIAGVAVCAIGIAGESLADLQLARFKRSASSKGKTCRSGLWRYSRHPNYFFETVVWIGFALIALPAPLGWIGLVGPALVLFLIWNVTGIPAAEAQAVQSRGQDYVDYQRSTSVFVPWFPRHAG